MNLHDSSADADGFWWIVHSARDVKSNAAAAKNHRPRITQIIRIFKDRGAVAAATWFRLPAETNFPWSVIRRPACAKATARQAEVRIQNVGEASLVRRSLGEGDSAANFLRWIVRSPGTPKSHDREAKAARAMLKVMRLRRQNEHRGSETL